MDLVENHDAETVEEVGARVDHVAENLGGHDHHRCISTDAVVAGQQSHPIATEPRGELAHLLIRERLDGSRVGDPATLGQCALDGVLRHERLARRRRCCDEYRVARVDDVERFDLEAVRGEALARHQGAAASLGLGRHDALDAARRSRRGTHPRRRRVRTCPITIDIS